MLKILVLRRAVFLNHLKTNVVGGELVNLKLWYYRVHRVYRNLDFSWFLSSI